MKFRDLLFRYLKEVGAYGAAMGILRSNFRRRYLDGYGNSYWFMLLCDDDGYGGCFGEPWWKAYSKFLSEKVYNPEFERIKLGDIVSVKTQEGKHIVEYRVCFTIYEEGCIVSYSGGKIKASRIVELNGKPFDYDNGWRFREKINFSNGK